MNFHTPKSQIDLSNMLHYLTAKELGTTATERTVLFQIVHSMRKDAGWTSWPSLDYIAETTGFSRRTVQRAVDKLIELDWLKKGKRKTSGSGFEVNTYTFNIQKFKEATGLTLDNPNQAFANGSNDEVANSVEELKALLLANKALTKHQAAFLIDSGKLSAIEKHQASFYLNNDK